MGGDLNGFKDIKFFYEVNRAGHAQAHPWGVGMSALVLLNASYHKNKK